jgi:hypothetical protein
VAQYEGPEFKPQYLKKKKKDVFIKEKTKCSLRLLPFRHMQDCFSGNSSIWLQNMRKELVGICFLIILLLLLLESITLF